MDFIYHKHPGSSNKTSIIICVRSSNYAIICHYLVVLCHGISQRGCWFYKNHGRIFFLMLAQYINVWTAKLYLSKSEGISQKSCLTIVRHFFWALHWDPPKHAWPLHVQKSIDQLNYYQQALWGCQAAFLGLSGIFFRIFANLFFDLTLICRAQKGVQTR